MNMNQLINMAVRMLMRKGMNAGINKGVALAARKGKQPDAMTPEEQAQAKDAQQTAQKARKGMRAARRFLR